MAGQQDDWEVTDEWEVIEPPSPVSSTPQAPKSWAQNAWDTLNTAPKFITDAASGFADRITDPRFGESAWNPFRGSPIDPYARGMIGGSAQGFADMLSPINVADAATGFGKGTAIRYANKGINAVAGLGGLQDVVSGNIPLGLGEMGASILGFRGIPKSGPKRITDPSRLLPAKGDTAPGLPRFFSGVAGVADNEVNYPGRVWPARPPRIGATAPPNTGLRVDETRPFGSSPGTGDIVDDISAIDAAARTVGDPGETQIPFRHPRGPLAPTPKTGPVATDEWGRIDYRSAGQKAKQAKMEAEMGLPPTRLGVEGVNAVASNAGIPNTTGILPSAEAKGAAGAGDKTQWLNELFNLPRALKSSFDLSAPLRQGLNLAHRTEFYKAFGDMARAWGSNEAYEATEKSIMQSPMFQLGQDNGLKLTEIKGPISQRQEDFMSKWATTGEFLPEGFARTGYQKTVGDMVDRSNRAYTAFLNKLRQDTFDSLIKEAKTAGLDPENNVMLTKEIATYINNATGRGSLTVRKPFSKAGSKPMINAEQNAVLLNNMLFSPRLIAARMKMLNPGTYIHADPFVRKQYLKSLIPLGAAASTMIGLGAINMGTVESDPRSSDFGKLKIGNTRLDPYGGYQQYMTLLTRLVSGQSKSTSTQNVYDLGQSLMAPSPGELIFNMGKSPDRGFVGNKLHPTITFGMDWLKRHKDRPFNISAKVGELFVPMIAQDLYELYKEDPLMTALLAPAMLGMSVNVFDKPTTGQGLPGGATWKMY